MVSPLPRIRLRTDLYIIPSQIAIVTNVGAVAWDRTVAFEEVFHTRGVQVVKKVREKNDIMRISISLDKQTLNNPHLQVMFDEYADGAMMRASGLIQEVRNTARGTIISPSCL